MEKETVLITGASSGIGKELAYHYAKDGYNIVMVARSLTKLTEIKNDLEKQYGGSVFVIQKDLSKESEIQEVYKLIKQNNMRVDILINNAGFGLFGEFLETDLEDELNMIDLNVKSLTYMTKLFLPDMIKQNKGGILNVASTAAFQPGPLMAVYYATKAYVLSFTEALENELKDTNITVSALCPGPTETGFSDRANLKESKLFKSGVMDVKTVAEIGYKGFKSGKTVIIPGLKNKILAGAVRFAPRTIITSIVRQMQERA
ncbi:SDR family oxidoreductase [Priestia megaterium]|nr:SDR family oxidoreductase [Priestia megaterium]